MYLLDRKGGGEGWKEGEDEEEEGGGDSRSHVFQ